METHALEYVDIPRATFCAPNVAIVRAHRGAGARAGLDVVVGKLQYGAVGAGTVYGDRSGVIKIVGDKKYGELVGGHIVGAKAIDLIQELVNAKALEGGYAEVARIVPATRRSPRASWRPHAPRMAGSSTAEHRPSSTTTSPRPRRTWPRSASSACSARCPSSSRSRLGAPRRLPLRRGGGDLPRRDRAARRRLRPAAAALAAELPADTRVGDARGHLRQAAGRVVAYSLAAFRQAFAAGRDLGERDTVLLAAAAAEMHPAAVLKARGAAAASGGGWTTPRRRPRAAGVPTCRPCGVGDRVFHGDRELEAAAHAARRWHEGEPRVRADRAPRRPRARRAGRSRARRPGRDRRDRHGRGRAVLGHRPRADRAACRAR